MPQKTINPRKAKQRDLEISRVEAEEIERITHRLEELHEGKEFHKMQRKVFRAIFKDGKKRIFIRKGRKGGGTHTILYPLVRLAGLYSNTAAFLFGPTLKLQKEIVWANRRLHEFIPKSWGVRYKESTCRAVFPNGSFIKIEGANDPELTVGIEGDIFVWDEFKRHNPMSYEYAYPNVASRDAVWIVVGSPPTRKDHYWKLEQQAREDPDWAVFHWSIWDNEFLPGGHDWIRKEKKKYYDNGNWDLWESEFEGKYVFKGRQKVLPNLEVDMMEIDTNVIPDDVLEAEVARDAHHMQWVCAIDPGYATCFGVLFCAYNPYSSEFYVLDEIYSTDRGRNGVPDIVPIILRKMERIAPGARWRTVYDSAALSFHTEVKSHQAFRHWALQPSYKEKDDEERFFRLINSLCATNRLKISEKCQSYIWEADQYETDDDGNYIQKNNHLLACHRYALKVVNYRMQQSAVQPTLIPDDHKIWTLEDELAKPREQVGFTDIMDISYDIDDLL